jgi:hypothetical protein
VVIRGTDRVADVLARDESLVDVFVAAAPAFARLRNPGMRRIMARLVTVEQAARVAGLDAILLLRRLNDAIGSTAANPGVEPGASASFADSAAPQPPVAAQQPAEPQLPAALAAVSPDRIIELDVREDLRNGQEPFSRIMAARRALAPGGVLCLRAIFEPVPLYDVFAKQGLAHWTDRLGDDDWMIWFYSAQLDPAAGQAAEGAGADAAHAGPEDALSMAAEPVILDVRGLEPPEPMQRTLEALADLPPGGTLIQLNVRVPQMLLPQLDARGYTYVVHTEADDRVRVVIHAPAVSTQTSNEQAIS